MATPTLTPSSVTIPSGGNADVTVTWTLDPGTPDASGDLSLNVEGAVFLIPVVKLGRPGETLPTMVLSNPQPGDVLVTCDVANVALVDQATIRLS